jgi:O-antigen/teichoic acid export membrane protein
MIKRILSNESVKQSTFLFFAFLFANFLHYVFHLFASRAFGPVSYGEFIALLSIYSIVSLPLVSVQNLLARFVSKYTAKNSTGKIKAMVHGVSFVSLCVAATFTLIFLLSSQMIISYFNLSDISSVFIVGVTIFLTFFTTIAAGVAQGSQKFYELGIGNIINGATRLLSGITFVFIGWGVFGALLGSVVGLTFFLAYYYIVLGPMLMLGSKAKLDDKEELIGYFATSFVVVLFSSLMLNIDVLLVKHFLDPIQAGYYGALSTMAKIFIFVPSPFVSIMFPKVSFKHEKGEEHIHAYLKTLYITALAAMAGLVICFFVPELIISIIFGIKFLSAVPYVLLAAFVGAVYALVTVNTNYFLAMNKASITALIVPAVIIEIVLINMFHSSVPQVLTVVLWIGIFLFVASTLSIVLFPATRARGKH